jgi:hypothetical protein
VLAWILAQILFNGWWFFGSGKKVGNFVFVISRS